MKVGLRKSLIVGGVFAVVLVAIVSTFSVVMYQRQSNMARWVEHTYKVLNKIKELQNVVGDMEASRRGYRSTNEPSLLDAYYSSLELVDPLESELYTLVNDNPDQAKVSAEVQQRLKNIIDYWGTLPVYTKDFPIEKKVAITRRENELMASLNKEISRMTSHERELLKTRTAANKTMIGHVMIFLLMGIAVVIGTVIVLMGIIRAEFKRRAEFQMKLRKSNAHLKNAILERQEVNAQLERFTYTVAHDLKSPLAGSTALANFLVEDERVNVHEDIKEMVTMLKETMEQLNERITLVLDYSRHSSRKQRKEDVDVHALVTEQADLLFIPGNFNVLVDGDLPIVKTNKAKLQQIFQNLMSNAIKYNDKDHGEIEIGYRDKGEFYEFYVKDNGPGIKENDTERIFGLFEVSDNEAHGDSSTGVGLNLLKTLVEEQGGRIWVDTHPGEGSTFYFQWRK